MEVFSWIASFHKDDHGFQYIKDVLPNLFKRFFVIPKVIGIIDEFPFTEYPINKDSIENLNKQHEIERKFGLFLNDDTENKHNEISLKELANLFKVKYCANTLNYIKQTPGISILYEQTKSKIKIIIESLKETEDLKLFIYDHSRYETTIKEWGLTANYTLEKTDSYIQFQEVTHWDSTSYLFTASLSWCLCTLEDFDHFILGINQDMHVNSLHHAKIELFEVGFDDYINGEQRLT